MQFVTSQCTIWSKERGCSYEDNFESIGAVGAVRCNDCLYPRKSDHQHFHLCDCVLLLVIAGCSICCIVKALWTSLAILAGMGLAAILIIFLLVWAVVKLETLGNRIKEFICY